MIAVTKKFSLLLMQVLSVTLCVGGTVTVANPDFELPEITSNLVILDPNDWLQVPGFSAGPYIYPQGQRAAESGIQRNTGVTGNAAYGNSNCGDIYQLLDDVYMPGRIYQLGAWVRNSWYGETVTAEFYYLADELNPEDRTVIASQTLTVDDGSNTDHDYKNIRLQFLAESGQTYIDKRIGIQFSGSGAGDRADSGRAWFNIDDVTCDLLYVAAIYPTDGADYVPVDTALSWTEMLAAVPQGYDVYLAEVSEPNIPLVSSMQTTTTYTPGEPLEYATTYQWRIDTHADPNVFEGMVWTFTTAPLMPDILDQPDSVSVFAGESVLFEVDATGPYTPLTYSWYKSLDNSTETSADDVLIQSGSSDTLEIPSAQPDDEGYYYCLVDDAITTPAVSDIASLLVKRLLARYEFGSDFADSVGNYDLTQYDEPAFVAGPDTLGSAAHFDGIDDYAYTDAIDRDLYAGFTLSLWVKTSSPAQPTGSTIIDIAPAAVIDVNSVSGNYRYSRSDDTVFGPVPFDEWTMLTVTFDGSDTTLYCDGIAVGNAAAADTSIDSISIGTDNELSLDGTFEGTIDDVRLYNYPLDKFGVYDLYYAVVPVVGCVNDYAFEADVSGPDGVPDCVIDMYDLAVFMQYWLACGLYPSCQ